MLCTLLHIAPYCIVLYCTVLRSFVLHSTTLSCTVLHCTSAHPHYSDCTPHSPSHTHTHSLTLTHTHTHSHTLSPSYTPTHTHTPVYRCGMKKMGDREKKYVHMLNATLCATGRAICCLLETYQVNTQRKGKMSFFCYVFSCFLYFFLCFL